MTRGCLPESRPVVGPLALVAAFFGKLKEDIQGTGGGGKPGSWEALQVRRRAREYVLYSQAFESWCQIGGLELDAQAMRRELLDPQRRNRPLSLRRVTRRS